MARKKAQGASVNLDSFLDIMTCLVGVLVLIIILTGIDASQIKVLIPTPMERSTTKRPVFIEARNNELHRLPLDELQTIANDTLRSISQESRGQIDIMLQKISEANVGNDAYRLDLSFALVGMFAVRAVEGVPGYPLTNWEQETSSDWFGSILAALDVETDMVTFLVRDDSFDIFKRARHLAWQLGVDVSYELLAVNEPIKFGLQGSRSLPQ